MSHSLPSIYNRYESLIGFTHLQLAALPTDCSVLCPSSCKPGSCVGSNKFVFHSRKDRCRGSPLTTHDFRALPDVDVEGEAATTPASAQEQGLPNISNGASRVAREPHKSPNNNAATPEPPRRNPKGYGRVVGWVDEATKNFSKKRKTEDELESPDEQPSSSGAQKQGAANGVRTRVEFEEEAQENRGSSNARPQPGRTQGFPDVAPKTAPGAAEGAREPEAGEEPSSARQQEIEDGQPGDLRETLEYKTSLERAYERAKAAEVEARLQESFAASEKPESVASSETDSTQELSAPPQKIRNGEARDSLHLDDLCAPRSKAEEQHSLKTLLLVCTCFVVTALNRQYNGWFLICCHDTRIVAGGLQVLVFTFIFLFF